MTCDELVVYEGRTPPRRSRQMAAFPRNADRVLRYSIRRPDRPTMTSRMKLVFVFVAAAGCMTPPVRPSGAGVSSPVSARPSEWSLRRVDYGVDAGDAAAASGQADARVA